MTATKSETESKVLSPNDIETLEHILRNIRNRVESRNANWDDVLTAHYVMKTLEKEGKK